MSADLESLIAEHVGIVYDSGAQCTCGKLLWTSDYGYTAGIIPQQPGKTVGEIAHSHHLAAVIKASEWFREMLTEAWYEGYDAGDQDARAVQGTFPSLTRNPWEQSK